MPLIRYRVHLRSVPGMYEQYDGYVDVYASHGSKAFDAACDKLRQESFPDRNKLMWRLDASKETPIERLDGKVDPPDEEEFDGDDF